MKRFDEPLKWRPICEMHEDHGDCAVFDGDTISIKSTLDKGFDPLDYVCFHQLACLSQMDVMGFQTLNEARSINKSSEWIGKLSGSGSPVFAFVEDGSVAVVAWTKPDAK
jgi:hypothetical protein